MSYINGKKILNTKVIINGYNDGLVDMAKTLIERTTSEVVIPESVTVIGEYAFAYCTHIKDIYIPKTISEIAFTAFEECYFNNLYYNGNFLELVKLFGFSSYIPADNVIYTDDFMPEFLTHFSFELYNGDIYLFEALTSLNNFCIENNGTLKIPEAEELDAEGQGKFKIVGLMDNAFGYTSAVKTLSISSTIETVSEFTFADGLENLEEITVSSENKNFIVRNGILCGSGDVGYRALCYPRAKSEETLSVSWSIEEIAPYAFCGLSKLKHITFESKTLKMSYSACIETNIETMTFYAPNDDEYMRIEYGACNDNPKLKTVTFHPNTYGTYDYTGNIDMWGTFENCPNLMNIYVPWAEGRVEGAPWGAENATITYNYTGE